ncbi:MAG TPA: hypothetical protein VLH81_09400, partial [Desulfobacterales bacterium]|nr:hypothetical protein [Desulfobacterales bacterium]
MASVRLTRLEVWTDFECAGGTRLGFFQPLPPSAVRTQEVNGEDTLRVSLYRDVDAWSLILGDRVLRAHLATGDYCEYRIADIGEEHQRDGKAVAEIVGEGPLYDLGHDLVAHTLVNGAVLHDFPLTLTPTEHLNVALEKTAGFTSGAGAW